MKMRGYSTLEKRVFYHEELSLQDVTASEVRIQKLTDAVEAECPFGKVMGTTGKGEGIVWKASAHCANLAFWFKSKGDNLAVSHSNKLAASAVAKENRQRMDNFAKAIVTEARLEQGWENTSEKDERSMGLFLKWVTNDCFEEKKLEMEKLEISRGKLNPVISSIAKPWFSERLRRAREEIVIT